MEIRALHLCLHTTAGVCVCENVCEAGFLGVNVDIKTEGIPDCKP